jgi:hypothetical protein
MNLKNALTLTKPILGCKVVQGRPRQLLRDDLGQPALVSPVWHDHFTLAASALDIRYRNDMIVFPKGYKANKFEEFVRSYNKFQKERFECIPAGATIEFEVMLLDDRLAPTDYAKILAVVGERLGLSQFGNKFGFGRFDINYVKRTRLSVDLNFEIDV